MVRGEAGRSLVEQLGASTVVGTVENETSWAPANDVDAIVHAAALVTQHQSWDRFYRVNVHGARLATEAAARAAARLVHISTVAVYGRQLIVRAGAPVAEDATRANIADYDYYARSKRLAEDAVWETSRELGVSAAALRPCVIYGERDRAVIGRVLQVLRLGLAPLIGPGHNRLAMVYAGNVAEAVLAALERPRVHGAFNTTNDGNFTQREFFETIGEAMGRRIRFVRVPVAGAIILGHAWCGLQRVVMPRRYPGLGASGARFLARDNPFTSHRAKRELEWQPSTPPREALLRAAHWFLEREGEGDTP